MINRDYPMLPKESEAFIITLLTKITRTYLEAQKNAWVDEVTEQENIHQIHLRLHEFRTALGWVEILARHLDLNILPYLDVDETILTAKNLNQCVVDLMELGFARRDDSTDYAHFVVSLYQDFTQPAEPIRSGDSIMAHIASSNASHTSIMQEGNISTVDIDMHGVHILDDEDEAVEKYISLFKGEEYDNDREDHSEGSSK